MTNVTKDGFCVRCCDDNYCNTQLCGFMDTGKTVRDQPFLKGAVSSWSFESTRNVCFFLNFQRAQWEKENVEDAKWVIRSRKSKDRQCKKTRKRTK